MQTDKNRNHHRKNKLMLQCPLNDQQQETLAVVKKLRGIDSNADLVRLLLDEEQRRLLL